MNENRAGEDRNIRNRVRAFVSQRGYGRTMLFWFLVLSLVPLATVSLVGNRMARSALHKQVDQSLVSMAHLKSRYLQLYLSNSIEDLELEAGAVSNTRFVNELHNAFAESGRPLDEFVKSFKCVQIVDERGADLKAFSKVYAHDTILIDSDGNVLFSVAGEADLGTNLFNGKYSGTRFARTCKETLETGKTAFSDFEFYAPSDNAVSGFLVSLLVDENGEKVGLLAVQRTVADIDSIMEERTGLGKTGTTYLVGTDLKMRSDTALSKEPTALKKSADNDVTRAWLKHVRNPSASAGAHEEATTSHYIGLFGRPVLGVHLDMDFAGVQWAFVAEMEESEVFAGTDRLRVFEFALLIATAGIVFVIAFWISGLIAKPIRHLTRVAKRVAAGDLTDDGRYEDRLDEVGELARSFRDTRHSLRAQAEVAEEIARGNLTVEATPRSAEDVLGNALKEMVGSLRVQIGEVAEAAGVVSSSANEILASTAQLVASSTESATALSQASTTVEEVRQTAQNSADRAKLIATDFQQTASVSEAGEQASEATVQNMRLIKEQMASIAESIVRLSEQSQAVGEIVSSVDDIADQSNLLAVNAAIEAARAGEQGKGFAVVANEIKTLAEESKKATGRVRSILTDIQKATGKAVLATEDGAKVVDEGARRTAKAGDTIRALTESVSRSSQAAAQIAASSQQQLAGMEQMGQAMGSIRQASEQNLGGARQLETAARNLHELGKRLQESVQKYKA